WSDSLRLTRQIKRIRQLTLPSFRSKRSNPLAQRDAAWIASSLQLKIAPQFCRELLAMTEESPRDDQRPAFLRAEERPRPQARSLQRHHRPAPDRVDFLARR